MPDRPAAVAALHRQYAHRFEVARDAARRMDSALWGALIEEPPLRLTPPYDREDRSLFRQRWENAETHRNRLRKRKTAVLLEALAEVELSGYERRCLMWVAAWETHTVATLAALMRRSYAAGVEAAREQNCNDNCNDADREQAS